MPSSKSGTVNIVKPRRPLRVGFLPENDCAPVVVAAALGIFRNYGLDVEIRKEAGWRQLHERMIRGETEAAHAPAMLPFLIKLGLTPRQGACVTGMVLSLQNSAITVSRELWSLGVRDATSLREQIWRDRNRKTYTFAVPCQFSTHYALLCQWLHEPTAPPVTAVRIEAVGSEQMFPLLKLGYLDGFCAGEPWNSVAVHSGLGVCVATGAELAPLHPEKVLMVSEEFSKDRSEEHERLIAALLEACAFCDEPKNRGALCELLAQPQFVNAPRECLEPDLVGPFKTGNGEPRRVAGLTRFHRGNANEPSTDRAAWLTGQLFKFFRWNRRPAGLSGVFRPDIFKRAEIRANSTLPDHLALGARRTLSGSGVL